jgi:uncharacterized damage-inducible protein DinB
MADDPSMTDAPDTKATLHRYLRQAREGLRSKLDGLSEYDAHRPLTPTGTNLLGLVKHVASVELGYLGDTFGRPADREFGWLADGADREGDMWAAGDESIAYITDFHDYVAAHTDATVDALDLAAAGTVPWWPAERRAVTLGQILVHLLYEEARHAGHADILRELLDDTVGQRPGDPNLPPGRDAAGWAEHRARIEAAAAEAQRRAAGDGPTG